MMVASLRRAEAFKIEVMFCMRNEKYILQLILRGNADRDGIERNLMLKGWIRKINPAVGQPCGSIDKVPFSLELVYTF